VLDSCWIWGNKFSWFAFSILMFWKPICVYKLL
jgi:hypothetical protein